MAKERGAPVAAEAEGRFCAMERAYLAPEAHSDAATVSPTKKQQKLIDAILGASKEAQPSEPADLRWRIRSFAGDLPEDKIERVQRSLEKRIEKLEESKRKAAKSVQLTDREQRIWQVIQRGAKGLQYCRELDSAGITPLRKGIWKDCPRKYESAYRQGELWRHRIQDEKSKARRKAELAKLASE